MQGLFRKGAFRGATADNAYFGERDDKTITEPDQLLGLVNVIVGVAPLKPVEFVIVAVAPRTCGGRPTSR